MLIPWGEINGGPLPLNVQPVLVHLLKQLLDVLGRLVVFQLLGQPLQLIERNWERLLICFFVCGVGGEEKREKEGHLDSHWDGEFRESNGEGVCVEVLQDQLHQIVKHHILESLGIQG